MAFKKGDRVVVKEAFITGDGGEFIEGLRAKVHSDKGRGKTVIRIRGILFEVPTDKLKKRS